MKKCKLPRTDSIQELAKFWDTHDVTDFEDELEEVSEPVFSQEGPIELRLESKEARALRRIADSKGMSQAELAREWVVQRLGRWKRSG